jgi:ACT domain
VRWAARLPAALPQSAAGERADGQARIVMEDTHGVGSAQEQARRRMSFLIRIQLQDRPGALGAVATALGKVGVDILSVDVVERRSGVAIDDLVVELPSGRLPDVLITAAESVEDVEVDAVRPWAGVLDTHRELELVEEIAANPSHGLQTFTDGVPKIIRAGWAVVLTVEEGKPQRVAASFAAPETVAEELPWWPLRRATILDGEDSWVPPPWRELGTELAATPLGGPERALLVGRPGGPMFRAAEVARLEHLAGIVAVVLRH